MVDAQYWQKPTDEKFWVVEEEFDPYVYEYSNEKVVYAGPDTSFSRIEITENKLNEENLKFIFGEKFKENIFLSPYIVASKSVNIDSVKAYFNYTIVYDGVIDNSNSYICAASDTDVDDAGIEAVENIRPIVVLPSSLQVMKTSSGYDLIQ